MPTAWAITSIALLGLMLAWSFATPLGAASDEPAHITKAAAVARGEFLGQPTTGRHETLVGHVGRALMTVVVPATYGDGSSLAACYRHHPKRTAACAPPPSTSGKLVEATTYVGRYPPLYYLFVGWPSRLFHSGGGIYFMRVLSVIASAMFLGLALAMASLSRSRWLLVGVALAATPMVVFLGSVVNPSGLEISAAIATWTTGLVLVMDRSSDGSVGLVVAFAASSCVLELVRGLSPLWLVLIILTLIALEPGGCWALIQRRHVQIAAAVIAFGGILAVVYIIGAGAATITPSGIPLPAHSTWLNVASLFVSRSPFYMTQIVGDFGWLDTPAPFGVVLLFGVAMVGLLWLSFATSRRRHAAVLVGLVLAVVIVPIAIDVKSSLDMHNDVWQSRYTMPLYVGVPLVAAAIAGRSKVVQPVHGRLLALSTIWSVVAFQLVCFYAALNRYTVGVSHTLDPLNPPHWSWEPPAPAAALFVIAFVAAVVYGIGLTRMDGALQRREKLTGEGSPDQLLPEQLGLEPPIDHRAAGI